MRPLIFLKWNIKGDVEGREDESWRPNDGGVGDAGRLTQRDGRAGSRPGRQVRLQRDGRRRGNGQAISHSQTAESMAVVSGG